MTFRERLQLHAFHFDREDKLSDVEMTTQGLWLTVSVARLGLGRGPTQRRPVLCVDDALTLLRTPTAGGVDGPRAVSRWPREEEGTPPAARLGPRRRLFPGSPARGSPARSADVTPARPTAALAGC